MNLGTLAAIAAAATLLVGASATQSQATTCQFGTAADFTAMTADVYTSIACEGEISGNDSESAVDGLFGFSPWTQTAKVDGTSGVDNILTVTSNPGTFLSGTWSVSSWDGITAAMIVIKGSTKYAGYLMDLSAGTSGGWTTNALTNNGGNQPAISHLSLYTSSAPCLPGQFGCFPPPVTLVPVPASLPLLGTIFLAAGVYSRTRRRKNAV